MAIDFFLSPCKTSSSTPTFGLCDNPPPAKDPAYISEDGTKKNKWIAQVLNKEKRTVNFYAIDHCVEIPKSNTPTKEESRCDGLLVIEDYYKFVELKDCKLKDKNWRRKGKNQLETTITIFKEHNPTISIKNISAQLCNKKHRTTTIYQDSQDEFFEKTGIVLEIKRQVIL
ncbi:MAG: hypothetical protein ACRBFS_07645 [Aureispira sp.]